MTTPELRAWECFQDASYYDMWCVRRVDDRTFGQGFHMIRAEEARALCDLLNTRTDAPADKLADTLDLIALTTMSTFTSPTHMAETHKQWAIRALAAYRAELGR